MAKKNKPQFIQTGKSTRILIHEVEYRGEEVIQIAKQYLDRHDDDWAFARGGFNVKKEDWEEFQKKVNAIKV